MLRRVIRLGAAVTMSAALVLASAAPSTATPTVHSGLQAALDCITAAGMPGTFAEVRNGYQTERAERVS